MLSSGGCAPGFRRDAARPKAAAAACPNNAGAAVRGWMSTTASSPMARGWTSTTASSTATGS
eukprot:2155064-Lingulodinium_polyedra.AAC.1